MLVSAPNVAIGGKSLCGRSGGLPVRISGGGGVGARRSSRLIRLPVDIGICRAIHGGGERGGLAEDEDGCPRTNLP